MENQPFNRLWHRLFLMVQGGCLLLALLLAAGIWRAGSSFQERLMSLFSFESAAKVDPRAIVVSQIRGASELTTAIYTMEAVVPSSRDRVVGNFVVGRTTLLYIAHGEVRAGVDLSEIDAASVAVDGDDLRIQLPPPRVLDYKIDVNQSKVFDYDRGFLGLGPDAAADLQSAAQQETLERIVTAACDNDLLLQANQRAETVVTQLLTTAGYASVIAETQTPNPSTCTVSAPASAEAGPAPALP
ncbi:MAG: DUF4230 domain-containing protein [Elainellaceae cyanobacterium]